MRMLLTDKAHDGVKNAVKVESVTQKDTGEKSSFLTLRLFYALTVTQLLLCECKAGR